MKADSTLSESTIIHNIKEHRFEFGEAGSLAVLEYSRAGEKIIITHTGVPPALEGQGIASRLARAALEYARLQKLQVIPLCSFVSGYIRKHPEYADLLQEK